METTLEIFAPPGYFRANAAWERWFEIRHGHEGLHGAARAAMQDAALKNFMAGVKTRTTIQDFLFILDNNYQRHEVPNDAWDRAAFPEMYFLEPQIRSHGKGSFGKYDGSIFCLDRKEIEGWARQDLREWLSDETKFGRLDIDKAREIWAKVGTGNLEGNPEPASAKEMLRRKSASKVKKNAEFEKYKASIQGRTTTRIDTRKWAREIFGYSMTVSEADGYDKILAACQKRKKGPRD